MNKCFKVLLLTSLVLLFFLACSNDSGGTHVLLNVGVLGNGSVFPNSGPIQLGSTVTFSIQAQLGWQFDRWEGANCFEVQQNFNQWQIFMNGNKSLLAVFKPINEEPGPVSYSLEVNSEGEGRVEPNSGFYAPGEMVSLKVIPTNGWYFDSWAGNNKQDLIGGNNNWLICMNDNKRIKAIFLQRKRSLNIDILGKGKVEERLISSKDYPQNSIVELWAKPDDGWKFVEWQGDASGTNQITRVTLNYNTYVTAVFAQDEKRYSLQVNKVGQGTVEEELINSTDYLEGSLVLLRAHPASGWEFSEWRDNVQTSSNSITVKMDSDKRVTAVFLLAEVYYPLNVRIVGRGQVSKEPDATSYLEGTRVILTASPDEGWIFDEWCGDIYSTSSQVKITMDQGKTVEARFVEEKNYYSLKVSINGQGTVTKKPDLNSYLEGTEVTLQAMPAGGWEFKNWSGDLSGTDGKASLLMDNDKSITANFQEVEKGFTILTMVGAGLGSVSRDPDKAYYQEGEIVIVEARPDPGWLDDYCECNGERYEASRFRITVQRDWVIIAYFQEAGY